MRLTILSAAALGVQSATAYLDTSPFFMFSTSPDFHSTTTARQIETFSEIQNDVSKFLSSCPTRDYVLVFQEGVHSSGYRNSKTTPFLAESLQKQNSAIKSTLVVPEVIDQASADVWQNLLIRNCDASPLKVEHITGSLQRPSSSILLRIDFLEPPSWMISDLLGLNDGYLETALKHLNTTDYTVIYVTSPTGVSGGTDNQAGENAQYEMDTPLFDLPETELKRDLKLHESRKDDNITLVDGPLFDRYQFFTPGIFMGYFAAFFLLAVLYVGVSALASLQVTYAAFDKDNGPLASKKAQ